MEYIQNLILATSVSKALIIMVMAIGCDLVSGVVKSLYEGNFKSGELRKGLYKKLEWLILMLFAYVVYLLTGVTQMPYGIAVICVFTEVSSILENLINMGLITNEWITKFFDAEKEE